MNYLEPVGEIVYFKYDRLEPVVLMPLFPSTRRPNPIKLFIRVASMFLQERIIPTK